MSWSEPVKARSCWSPTASASSWDVSGPHFGGWEIYHLKGSSVDPNRHLRVAVERLDGQIIQRSNDGGKTWEAVGNKFVYDGVPGTHQWYDGTPHPWEFKRVWHLEPSLTDPDTVYAGVEDAALFRTTDGGQTLERVAGPSRPRVGRALAAGRGRTVPAHHSDRPLERQSHLRRDLRRRRVSHRRGGKSWRPINRGLKSAGHPGQGSRGRPLRAPDRDASFAADVLFMQKHWDVMRTDNAGESWREVSGNLPSDFGFPIDVHAHEPETIYVVPIKSDSASTIRRRASCASIAAAPAATSGRH